MTNTSPARNARKVIIGEPQIVVLDYIDDKHLYLYSSFDQNLTEDLFIYLYICFIITIYIECNGGIVYNKRIVSFKRSIP
uniref:KTSC domain-containing protein n=1 Tax=Heterorhabditis bacteriophora TaxID=37862 RepID=A0A1I7W691_HETBA